MDGNNLNNQQPQQPYQQQQGYQQPQQQPYQQNYQQPYQQNYQQYPQGQEPGKGNATASMVVGIIAVLFWWFGYSAIISVVLGVVGLVLAANSKNAGYNGGMRTAGFVLSLIGLIGGAVVFVSCIACSCAASNITSSFNYWY